MAFFKTTGFNKLYYPVLALSLLIFSCTSDNAITKSTDLDNMAKPQNISNFNTPYSDSTSFEAFINSIPYIFRPQTESQENVCFIFYLFATKTGTNNQTQLSKGYNFRDEFLSKSGKGNSYIVSYYILSKYGISNNLVMKYSLEHLALMNLGLELSFEFQHGTNDNKILINKSTYDDLKSISKIYRQSENHQDIEPVLDYLEADLEKYYNRPKAEIAADFGF